MSEDEGNNNVVSFKEKSKAKNAKKSKNLPSEDIPKLSSWQKQAFIAEWLNSKKPDYDPPNTKFILIRAVDGSEMLYKVTPDCEIESCAIESVEKTVACAVHKSFGALFDFNDRQIQGAVRYWAMITNPTEKPQLFGWSDSQHLVRRRLPFSCETGPTPLFDEMMSRFTNSDALMAFIGSLFFPDSNMQQYVWMYGQGNDGKGTLSRFLARALGHLYTSQQTPSVTDRFWTYGIKDARLVVFPDTNNTSFVTSGLFKALTGGDWVRVEIKGGKVFCIQPMAKFMFLSNEQPDLSSEKADQRRIIYCHCQSFEAEHDSTYEARLWLEGGYFLSKCVEAYKAACPNHEQIIADREQIVEITATNEEPFSAFLSNEFNVSPSMRCKPAVMQGLLEKYFKSRKEQKDCRAWLERMGYVKKAVKDGATRQVDYFYVGLAPKYTGF